MLLTGLVSMLLACNLIPDRAKEYQYSEEIPSLEIPPDLSTSAIEQAASQRAAIDAGPAVSSEAGRARASETRDDRTLEVPKSQQLERGEDMPSHLVINDPYPIAWRLIGKALARMDLEITDRDRSTGYYYVLYAEPEDAGGDSGLLSGLAFWKGDEPQEDEYRIKLEDNEGKTEVFVLDDSGAPLSKGTGLELLKQMQEQIKAQPADAES